MEVLHDVDSCPRPPQGAVVTIGAFDGVHIGHQAVIERLKILAGADGAATAVVTFDRHPATVVRPESAPKLLCDLDTKLELLAATGVDYTLVVHFDEARSKESAEDFVAEVLAGCLNATSVVVGHDFHFGHRRRGNIDLLAIEGVRHGFSVAPLDLLPDDRDHEVVSSTRIRHLLDQGEVVDAARLLGRPHEVRGCVEHGDERGRTLGFPTANVSLPDELQLPADGIYACWYERPDGSVHPAAVSLGRRPTFYDQQPYRLLEAFLLDFGGDLYGEKAKVRFVARLRGEAKFDSVEALVAQMDNDVAAARTVLR